MDIFLHTVCPLGHIMTKNKFDHYHIFNDQIFLVAIILTTKLLLFATILMIDIFWSLKVQQLIPISLIVIEIDFDLSNQWWIDLYHWCHNLIKKFRSSNLGNRNFLIIILRLTKMDTHLHPLHLCVNIFHHIMCEGESTLQVNHFSPLFTEKYDI